MTAGRAAEEQRIENAALTRAAFSGGMNVRFLAVDDCLRMARSDLSWRWEVVALRGVGSRRNAP